MPKNQHQGVSSEGPQQPLKGQGEGEGQTNPHAPVSSEGGESTIEIGELAQDQVAEDFEGDASLGQFEQVPGFDPTRAASEGQPEFGESFMVEDLEMLPPSCTLEYENPETLCGTDDRVQMTATTSIPWRWICQLIITMANGGQSRCTGWFIGPCTVMTAGHCVFSHSAGGWARRIEVIPGMNGGSRPYGSQISTSFRSVNGWTGNSPSPNYDYGACVLPNSNLGNTVGWFGFAALTDSSLQNLLVNNSGYAGDKPFGTQWFNAGRITNVTSRKFYYMLDTFGGQSGSPTWRLQNGQRHAVGIHAYGGCPNSSTRIVQPVFNNMLTWRNACS